MPWAAEPGMRSPSPQRPQLQPRMACQRGQHAGAHAYAPASSSADRLSASHRRSWMEAAAYCQRVVEGAGGYGWACGGRAGLQHARAADRRVPLQAAPPQPPTPALGPLPPTSARGRGLTVRRMKTKAAARASTPMIM